MTQLPISKRDFTSELIFKAVRSSGPGGQNVNKVNTKIELRFNVPLSANLTDDEKVLIGEKLKNLINAEGELVITSQSERSQLKNKEKAIIRFIQLLTKALTVLPPRKKTQPTFSSQIRRLDKKRNQSIKKVLRQKKFDRHSDQN